MLNLTAPQNPSSRPLNATVMTAEKAVNAIDSDGLIDGSESTPKLDARRSWRRRRIRRGKT